MGVTAKQLLDLQCCDLTDPLGVGGEVFFSWRCCGFFQKSYRVQITDESGACVLDTGEIASDRPFTDRLIPPLRSSARYRWSVCVTDRQGERIQSGTAVFETALLEEKELAVPFITSEWENPVFMKTFTACAGETERPPGGRYLFSAGVQQLPRPGFCRYDVPFPRSHGLLDLLQHLRYLRLPPGGGEPTGGYPGQRFLQPA